MSAFFITVLIFIMASVIGSAARRGQPPAGRPQIPWFPLENLPDRRLREPWRQVSPWEQDGKEMQTDVSGDIDPVKEEELSKALGKEGERGDNGRPGMLRHRAQSRNDGTETTTPDNKPLSQPTRVTAEILEDVVTSPVPFNDPVPDLMLKPHQLMQGVVWSEILGRPKALRQYKRSRYQ